MTLYFSSVILFDIFLTRSSDACTSDATENCVQVRFSPPRPILSRDYPEWSRLGKQADQREKEREKERRGGRKSAASPACDKPIYLFPPIASDERRKALRVEGGRGEVSHCYVRVGADSISPQAASFARVVAAKVSHYRRCVPRVSF